MVVMESSRTKSGKHDISSTSGNDTDAENTDIKPIYNEEPLVEVQLIIECNVTATGQQHTEQPKIINEGKVDQNTEQCQVKSHMLDSSIDNKTTEYSNQSLKSENIVNSRAKVKSHKTRNNNKPVEQKSHAQKPGRYIFTSYRFSHNKSSAVYEKTSSRSCLRWKPTGRIFKTIGLRWIPTGKLLDSYTGKVDSEPLHGFMVDISKIHEYKQTLDLSTGTSISAQKKQSIDLSADASDKCQQQRDSTSSTSTLATNVFADGNFDFQFTHDVDEVIRWLRLGISPMIQPEPEGSTYRHSIVRLEVLRYKRRCCNLNPAKSYSLPHDYTQALKVNHSTLRLLLLNKKVIGQKAQVHVKFSNSDNYELLHHQRYSKVKQGILNKLAKDFGKRFVTQKELSTEQDFWLHLLNLNSEQLDVPHTPVKIEVHKELPKRLEQENDYLFELLLSQDIVHICINSLASRNECCEMKQSFVHEYNENLMLKAELAKKEHMVEKSIFDEVLDLEPLAPKVLNNRDAHIDYIKHSREHADTLREIVKHARALRPLDGDLDSTCMIVQRIQEVLVYVKATCPSLTKHGVKLVAITPLNKNKKVRWKPTRWTFTIDGNTCPLTRITSTKVVPLKETTSKSIITQNPEVKVYSMRPKVTKSVGSSSKYKIVKSRISNNSEPNQSWGANALDVSSSSLVDFRFGNDQIVKIMGYKDYQMGNVTISQVYYVEGLGHNLFPVGEFCDSYLKVAFRKHTCYIRDLEGVDLLKGSRGSNLYTLSLEDMMLSSPICLVETRRGVE
ncbi:hypothetical protein Tco_0963824 [Tanacetum coccineum]